jgi:RND family efflux transporter MFP subunit
MRCALFINIMIAGLLVVSGCSSSAEEGASKPNRRTVRTREITVRDLPVVVSAVGRLVPNREVVVSSQVMGILKAFNADVGSRIKAKDILVKLDDVDYTLALNEAHANLAAAQAKLTASENAFERAKKLLPAKAITPELYDRAEAEYRSSQALVSQLKVVVDIARQRLGKTIVKAPFDGFVTKRFVELGQNVTIGDPVMGIADMETMRVRIHINEQDYVHLDKDDPVTVVVEAFSDQPFPGRVDKIGIKADARTNTFEVEVLLDNPRIAIKAGMTARVSIQTEIISATVMIPQNSVLFREDRKEVYVIEDTNKAAAREVKLGRMEGASVQIRQGLVPGDRLVVSGAQFLKSGDEVIIAP